MLRPLIRNFRFFFFIYLLEAVSLISTPWGGSRFVQLQELFLDLYILSTILYFLPAKACRIAKVVIASIIYPITLLDSYLYNTLGQPITPQLYSIVWMTNTQEATAAVTTYLSSRAFASVFPLMILIAVCHLYFHFCNHKISVPFKSTRIADVAIIGLLVFSICNTWQSKAYRLMRTFMQMSDMDIALHSAQGDIPDITCVTWYYTPIHRTIFALSENNRLRAVARELKDNCDNVTVNKSKIQSPLMVLIINESYNRHHSQLYGYDKITTPYQMDRFKKHELSVFTDVISPWNLTCESFQQMMSLGVVGDSKPWYEHPFVTPVFRKAGYKVCMLSNQYVIKPQDSFSDFTEDIFMSNPNINDKLFDDRNKDNYSYDHQLLNLLPEPSKLTSPTFLIIHFMGMHFMYNERYPESWRRFSSKDYHNSLSDEENSIMASYDNAIRYNDYVIEKILNHFEGEDAIVIHTSDHGELVYDNSVKENGRSFVTDRRYVNPQHEIPFWIWTSEKFKKRRPELYKRIEDVKNKKFMTDALPHLLIGVAGISTPSYIADYDILSPDYNEKRKRLLQDRLIYDL